MSSDEARAGEFAELFRAVYLTFHRRDGPRSQRLAHRGRNRTGATLTRKGPGQRHIDPVRAARVPGPARGT